MNQPISQEMHDYLDSLSSVICYKDEQCVYQHANAAFGALMGLGHHLDIVGGTDFDIPCDAVACAEAFQEEARLVMRTGKEHKILDIHPFADGQWHVYATGIKPWLDEQGKIIGTFLLATDITDAYSMAISSQLAKYTGHRQNSYTLSDDGGTVSLTQRESEVLFLILRGKTAKLIASILGDLSYRTIEGYLEKIRLKFGAKNRTELFDIAMERGYMNQIPLSMFSKQLSIVLGVE